MYLSLFYDYNSLRFRRMQMSRSKPYYRGVTLLLRLSSSIFLTCFRFQWTVVTLRGLSGPVAVLHVAME